MKIIKHDVKLITSSPYPEQLIEQAGRVCYKSEEKITNDSAVKFVRGVTRRGHHSVIEHASATFRIITDRGITHEIVRHRLASYSQESTRYVNYGGTDMQFIVPCALAHMPPVNEIKARWLQACLNAEYVYNWLINDGTKPQVARSILPNCLKTEIVMTANFREWRHFVALRSSAGAHPDIRIIACWVWKILNTIAPSVFDDLYNDDMQEAHKLYDEYYSV